jgi:hypothetical protein
MFLKIAIQRATTQARVLFSQHELNLQTRHGRPQMLLVKTAVQVTANLTVWLLKFVVNV